MSTVRKLKPPTGVLGAVTAAVESMAWLGPSDAGMVELAKKYAALIDAAEDDPKTVGWLGQNLSVSVHDGARQTAAAQLPGVVQQHADEILTDHLQPALDEITTATRDAAKVLPIEADDRQLLLADLKVRRLWSDLDGLTHRYSLVRAAQHEALTASGQQAEDEDEWAAYDDMVAVWPGWSMRTAYRGNPTPPWPTDPRQFLLWHAHHGTRFVALTITERNARWHAKYDADLDHRRALHASAVATGGGTWVA
jgi:hypothetical protein